jgi:hypothetical protein
MSKIYEFILDNLLEVLTLATIIVALVTPYITNHLSNKPKKSKLKLEKFDIVNQDNGDNYYMGRLIIKNEGKFIAKSVEPYLDNVKSSESKKYFFPVPLKWTHSELNSINPSVRDIYPNQTVYLDLFYYEKNSEKAKFIIAAGKGLNDLETVSMGKNEISIVFYQESGQKDEFDLEIFWERTDKTPEIKFL